MTTTFKIRRRHDTGRTASRPPPRTPAGRTSSCSMRSPPRRAAWARATSTPYLTTAGLTAVSAPDPRRSWSRPELPTALLLTQAYVPILPKHIWEGHTLEQIGNAEADDFFTNEPPVVGTGPYQAVRGSSRRASSSGSPATRAYWGEQGAADEVIIQHFESNDTMVQALRNGEIDYVRGVGADAVRRARGRGGHRDRRGLRQRVLVPDLQHVQQADRGRRRRRPPALADPGLPRRPGLCRRPPPMLVDRVLAGHGVPGTTNVPPFHANWHVRPPADAQRTFDIEEAKRRLDRRRLRARRRRTPARQGRQPDHPSADVARLGSRDGHGRPVHHGVVGRARASRSTPR